MEEICEEIESDGDIEDFAKDIILNQENFENNLYLFDKYVQGFDCYDSTQAANYYTRRLGEKFDVLFKKYMTALDKIAIENSNCGDAYRNGIVKFTQKVFDAMNTFNGNGLKTFVTRNIIHIEECAFCLRKEDFVENFLEQFNLFIPKGRLQHKLTKYYIAILPTI